MPCGYTPGASRDTSRRVHELTLQTFYGTPLALLPSAILLTWLVQQRLADVLGRPRTPEADARAELIRKAALAAGFAIATSALAALVAGACVVFRVAGQVPLLAMQTLALLAMVVAAAMLTVEVGASVRARNADAPRHDEGDA